MRGGRPIPIEFEGVRYPSRTALAQHLAATRGHAVGTWAARLSRFDGDVARALVGPVKAPRLSLAYQGRSYTRKGLAQHLAATHGGTIAAWNARLIRRGDDVAASIASLDRPVRTAATHAAVRKAVERATELRPHIEAARKAGCTTLRQLAHALNESGITTARGGKWDASAVWRALRRMG